LNLYSSRNEFNTISYLSKYNLKIFSEKVDSIKDAHDKLISNTKNLDPNFVKIFKLNNKYENLFYKMYYKNYNTSNNEEFQDIEFKNQEQIDNSFVDDDFYIYSKYYIYFINNKLSREFYDGLEVTLKNDSAKVNYLKFLSKKFKSPKLKDVLMFIEVDGILKYIGEDMMPQYIEVFNKSCTNEDYKNIINDSYEFHKKLFKGNEFADFEVKDLKGKKYTKDSFKGKLLFIDVWASWCVPCNYQIPYLKKLYSDYKDKNIEFVSISIDENKDDWINYVKENDLHWLQLHIENGWDSKIIKDNRINGIPRFILIDENGLIICINTPRPSSDQLRTLIDQNLQ
jgi:thiol-disulfide isomerase/thioredoxin